MRLILIAAALSIALIPSTSFGANATARTSKADPVKCAKAKKDRAWNTPMGQGKIKLACTSGMTAEDFAREITRHQKCVSKTGRICAK